MLSKRVYWLETEGPHSPDEFVDKSNGLVLVKWLGGNWGFESNKISSEKFKYLLESGEWKSNSQLNPVDSRVLVTTYTDNFLKGSWCIKLTVTEEMKLLLLGVKYEIPKGAFK